MTGEEICAKMACHKPQQKGKSDSGQLFSRLIYSDRSKGQPWKKSRRCGTPFKKITMDYTGV